LPILVAAAGIGRPRWAAAEACIDRRAQVVGRADYSPRDAVCVGRPPRDAVCVGRPAPAATVVAGRMGYRVAWVLAAEPGRYSRPVPVLAAARACCRPPVGFGLAEVRRPLRLCWRCPSSPPRRPSTA